MESVDRIRQTCRRTLLSLVTSELFRFFSLGYPSGKSSSTCVDEDQIEIEMVPIEEDICSSIDRVLRFEHEHVALHSTGILRKTSLSF